MFCFWRIILQPAVICNPSTRQVKFLPKLDVIGEYHYSFGFEPEAKIYKVIFMVRRWQEMYARMWVFTLGKEESWRETGNVPHLCRREGVCINGVIYMFYCSHFGTIEIVAFDVKTESFIISCCIIMLEASSSNIEYYKLMEVEGKLTVLETRLVNGGINLWILGMSQHERWEKHIILGFPATGSLVPDML
ncbi:hypothetical protein BC332_22138 [Capsicum chinense]|nr:hypothetical protein BC332_22138 [Capsicum chinense]